MRFALPVSAALLALVSTVSAADGVRTAAHLSALPLAPQPPALDASRFAAEGARPNARVVQPTPLARRGTLFGSVYHGDNDPVNPNLLRHAPPNRSRRKAITW